VSRSFDWPDVILQVDASSRSDGRVSLRFEGVLAGKERVPFGTVEVNDPHLRVSQIAQLLDEWAAKGSDPQSLSTHLAGIGSRLFRDLVPIDLQKYYWSVLHHKEGASVLVLATNGAELLPWELVKPIIKDDEAPFWCEHLALSRWLATHPILEALPDHPSACVLADPSLADVAAPAHNQLRPTHIVEDWLTLKELLACDGIGLFHWTGHGVPCRNNPSLSALPISTETFRPVNLLIPNGRRFLNTHPWVFLHACSTAHLGAQFLGLGGWPTDLIEAGAGAVLATAWDVRASTATLFAQRLYEHILHGDAVGNAVRKARTIARCHGDPSWLAYQLYAHPNARVVQGMRAGTPTHHSVKAIVAQEFPVVPDPREEWRLQYFKSITERPRYRYPHDVLISVGATAEVDDELDYSTLYIEPTEPRRVESHSFRRIVDALIEFKSFVLLGRSGSGKTASLHKILIEIAESYLNDRHDLGTPIYISLDEYDTNEDPLEYVRRHCDTEVRPHLDAELAARRVRLLCDGLNVLPRTRYQESVRLWRQFMTQHAGNCFVFSSRPSFYADEFHIQRVEISALDDEHILRALFATVGEAADRLWNSVDQAGLLDLARTPLFLKWISQCYRASGGHLPRNRSLLLEGLLKSLVLRERETHADAPEWTGISARLADIAFAIQHGRAPPEASSLVPRTELDHSDMYAAPSDALKFALGIGLIKYSSGLILFSDPQFQDFFAGLAIANRFEDTGDVADYCNETEGDIRPSSDAKLRPRNLQPVCLWEDAVILASGLLRDASAFLRNVLRANPRLAGDCISKNRPACDPVVFQAIRSEIQRISMDASVSLARRFACATALGHIGDPRLPTTPGTAAALYIPPDLVDVPAGYVELGSKEQDELAFEDERPCHRVEVAAFQIGRFCVTNAEYRLFVESGAYSQREHWTDQGWDWRLTKDAGEGFVARILRNVAYFRGHRSDMERWFSERQLPALEVTLWRELLGADDATATQMLLDSGYGMTRSKEAPPFITSSRYGGENQPVVGVTWFEASAYCSWLSKNLSRKFSLPTEPQWERAAKGDRDRIYPWGDSWSADRANGLSEQLLQPSPVGIFPAGRSQFGCYDMIGNVFEWTRSVYRPYPYQPADGREEMSGDGVRVVRGGGWDSVQRVLRCSLRGDMCPPNCYDSNVGFRVVATDTA
jgi:formylglycine-generating enzyme required for sulfatase activity